MHIDHLGGRVECPSWQEAREVFKKRFGDGINEFWIAGEEKYPCLAVLVNRVNATLHYFAGEGEFYQCIGQGTGLDPEGMSRFYIGGMAEETEVMNDAVVTFQLAEQAAREFFETGELPTCLTWRKL